MSDSPRNPQQAAGPQGRARIMPGMVLFCDPLQRVASLSSVEGYHDEIMLFDRVSPDGGGDFSTPSPGHYASVTDEHGMPGIHRYMPTPRRTSLDVLGDDYGGVLNTWLTLTGTDGVYRTFRAQSPRHYRSNRPGDLVAGDQGFRSDEGAMIAALRGGVALVKASDLCQLILNQVDDLARLLGRNLDFFTDWGQMQFNNDRGSTRLRLRGSRDAQKTRSGKFDFELRLGGSAREPFLALTLYDKEGAGETNGVVSGTPVASVRIDQQGKQHVYLANDQLMQVGGSLGLAVTRDVHWEVGGDVERVVDGVEDVRVSKSHQLSARDSTEVLQDRKTVRAPEIHLGSDGGVGAAMADVIEQYLKNLKKFLDNQLVLMTPAGPSTPPGAVGGLVAGGSLSPDVPDLYSKVLFYPQEVS